MVVGWSLYSGSSDELFSDRVDGESRAKHFVPILILTSRAEELDKILGLEIGADDYLTKPFNLEELLLRVKNLINKGKRIAERKLYMVLWCKGGYGKSCSASRS